MPSLPTSLIIVCLVVAWLVVLVPMVAKRREEVPSSDEDGDNARVLDRGTRVGRRRAVLSRTVMAHRSRPDDVSVDDEAVVVQVEVSEDVVITQDVPALAADSFDDDGQAVAGPGDLDGAGSGRRAGEPVGAATGRRRTGGDYQRVAAFAEPAAERDSWRSADSAREDRETAGVDDVRRESELRRVAARQDRESAGIAGSVSAAYRQDREPVVMADPERSTGSWQESESVRAAGSRQERESADTADSGRSAGSWQESESARAAGSRQEREFGRGIDAEREPEAVEYRRAPVRPGRGGFNPAAADQARAYRFRQRRRVALALLLIVAAGAAAGWLGYGFGYPTAVGGGVLLVLYFAYLRRQVRIEVEIRQRRLARLDRARQIRPGYRPSVAEQVYAHRTGEIPRPGVADEYRVKSHVRSAVPPAGYGRGVPVDLDDSDPVFDDLEYYRPAVYRRRAG